MTKPTDEEAAKTAARNELTELIVAANKRALAEFKAEEESARTAAGDKPAGDKPADPPPAKKSFFGGILDDLFR